MCNVIGQAESRVSHFEMLDDRVAAAKMDAAVDISEAPFSGKQGSDFTEFAVVDREDETRHKFANRNPVFQIGYTLFK